MTMGIPAANDTTHSAERVFGMIDLYTSGSLHTCPAFLRANKRVHSEANPLLYSKNRSALVPLCYETQGAIVTSFP